MGYESVLHLIDIKIKPESLPAVNEAMRSGTASGFESLSYFLRHLTIDSAGFLCFRADGSGPYPYEPDDEGTVPALYGKWYEDEEIAGWLKVHSQEGGRIVLHSIEADGEAWGWEFDGKGRMRRLQLCSVGKWI